MCVGEAVAHKAKRPHAKDVIFDTFSLLPMGERQSLEGILEVGRLRFVSLRRGRP